MNARNLVRRCKKIADHTLTRISPKLNSSVQFALYYGKLPNLKQPRTFSEKLLWLKLFDYSRNPKVIQCADKVAVRDYVREHGYGHLLNEVIGVYDTVDDIPWEELPNQFALKWNFGATYNIICADKPSLDKEATLAKLRKWGKEKYWLANAEMHYEHCPKKLI